MQLFEQLLRTQHPLFLHSLLPSPSCDTFSREDYYRRFSEQFRVELPGQQELSSGKFRGSASQYQQDVEHELMMFRTYLERRKQHESGKYNLRIDDQNSHTKEGQQDENLDEPSASSPDGQQTDTQASPQLNFISILRSRLRMFFRQPMEVNLEVTQLVVVLACISPQDLFCNLFLSPGATSLVEELDFVRMFKDVHARCGGRQLSMRRRSQTSSSIFG